MKVDMATVKLTNADGQITDMNEHISALSQRLSDIKDAVAAQDTVLLSDILEYEFPDLTSRWHDFLGRLAGEFAEEPS